MTACDSWSTRRRRKSTASSSGGYLVTMKAAFFKKDYNLNDRKAIWNEIICHQHDIYNFNICCLFLETMENFWKVIEEKHTIANFKWQNQHIDSHEFCFVQLSYKNKNNACFYSINGQLVIIMCFFINLNLNISSYLMKMYLFLNTIVHVSIKFPMPFKQFEIYLREDWWHWCIVRVFSRVTSDTKRTCPL